MTDIETLIYHTGSSLADPDYQQECRTVFKRDGVLVLEDFLQATAVAQVRDEAMTHQQQAYFCQNQHTVYLSPPDTRLPDSHIRNRMVTSSKGCITDDIVPSASPLRVLYNAPTFRAFLCAVLEEQALYPYADPMSSINIHYARRGQELGWHFDNSAFAITLMIQPAESGGVFEYVSQARDSAHGDMNYPRVEQVLQGEIQPRQLALQAGSLVLFRGRDALHRVTPNTGDTTRLLVVLAYNTQPGIALEAEAMRTFYGRVAGEDLAGVTH